jgi:hypothetical protein
MIFIEKLIREIANKNSINFSLRKINNYDLLFCYNTGYFCVLFLDK